jgi:hypothetical protein
MCVEREKDEECIMFFLKINNCRMLNPYRAQEAVSDLQQLLQEKQQFMRRNVGISTREFDSKIR